MSDDDATPAGFTWDDYIGELVREAGSLTAVAEKLAAARRYEDDVGSVERALRRLRTKGLHPGGKWGARLVSLFGLPQSVETRLRWMAFYHSRFTDLPVPLCEDLVRLWDHPPTTERKESRAWLALARASIALRRNEHDTARTHVAHVEGRGLPAEVHIEGLLIRAFIESKADVERVPELLAQVEPWLPKVESSDDRWCLQARYIDQRAYDLNRGREGKPDHAAAEALYRLLPASDAPPFVLCRRANGLAYARWKQGYSEEAANLAREAARHAGDGGHVRLRVMALNMLARIDPREAGARDRALEMSKRLEDETLLLRLRYLNPKQS